MSYPSVPIDNEAVQKLLVGLQNDFKTLAQDTKKKYPLIKESCEEAIGKLKSYDSGSDTPVYYVINQILFPLVQGCESKDIKIIRTCLGMIQRLIIRQVIDQKGARYITDTLWTLMENSTEEVKVLQTVSLLLTTNTVVHGETLAKNLVLCFRLHFSKDPTTVNAAAATVRQLVSMVFERVIGEQESKSNDPTENRVINYDELKTSTEAPKGLSACASDAFLLFQDLVQLVNKDQPYWLIGIKDMTRSFGLELLETVLLSFPSVFYKNPEFSFQLKEHVCALVIKLFSPNIKYRTVVTPQQVDPHDKPYFPISMRLLRVVSILIQKYHSLLITECEIFLSLIVKFLDPDKPTWQRSLALEVIHKMVIQTDLLVSFCKSYDLRDDAINIFQDIINSLGTYVQSLSLPVMSSSSTNQQQPGSTNTPMGSGPGMTPPAGFYFRNVWFPLVTTFPTGQAKSTYLDMLDKTEPPNIPDGYGISVSYACLLELVRSISLAIQGPSTLGDDNPISYKDKISEEDKTLHIQIINSSWCGLLSSLTPLAEAATDESTTENILKAMQNYAALCGLLELTIPRDAFITALCKASLPHQYALAVLSMGYQGTALKGHGTSNSPDLTNSFNSACGYDNEYRQQIVAVGTPLPTASMPVGVQQGPVMLTAKNLQCMRALLHLALCHGSILGSSWHIVLATLQHLAWILGLKPSTGGSLQANSKPATDANAGITTFVMSDLPVLSQMLSRLFESSQQLDDVALHHLIDALCKLSDEAMTLPYTNREPSLFAVAKLLETGLMNLSRIEVLWLPLTNHLLKVCQHPHSRMREWGVEAMTYLVKTALLYKYEKPLKNNMALQTLLLNPLSELSTVRHGDVRQKQLECVLNILNGSGESLVHGWPYVLKIIGAVNNHHGDALIRIAFQCLQLVVTDFLPVMPVRCLPLCVNTAATFGSQTQELNISLTAVGLMWNISDFFNQNQDKLMASMNEDNSVLPDFPGTPNMPHFDRLWMCLFARLGELCVDLRPAVRKSAGQTLFSTISAHGNLLSSPTWQAVLWQVLFPLLDRVRNLSGSASNEKVDTSGNILIHHSRNTAQKQWAETQVLTLSGVSRVFNTKRVLLQSLGDYPRAWALLLEFIEHSALSKSNEVSLAALKSFQEVLYIKTEKSDDLEIVEKPSAGGGGGGDEVDIWNMAWRIWIKIGLQSTKPVVTEGVNNKPEDLYVPSQSFLTALVQIFPALFQHIKTRFTETDLRQLCQVLNNAATVPIHSETTPYIKSTMVDSPLTPLHDGILDCVEILQKEAMTPSSNLKPMIPDVFKQLLSFIKFACHPMSERSQRTMANNHDWSSINDIPFGEKALTVAVKLYEQTATDERVIDGQILPDIIKTLHLPLSMKYNCMSPTTWKLAINSLMTVLHVGLQVARRNPQPFATMWDDLSNTFDRFLFPSSVCPIEERTLDDIVYDEQIDCQVIELLRDEVLPFSHEIPHQFILNVVVILNKGSIHSATVNSNGCDAELKLREEFAKICFETLLQFSLLDDSGNNNVRAIESSESGVAGRLAVTALLHRFQEVLKRFTDDERQSGKYPLPRYRMSEIAFVLKAVTTLIISMKKAPKSKVGKVAWEQLIGLYPYLVDCTTTSSPEVSRSLREALFQFCDLLQPPANASVTANGVSSHC